MAVISRGVWNGGDWNDGGEAAGVSAHSAMSAGWTNRLWALVSSALPVRCMGISRPVGRVGRFLCTNSPRFCIGVTVVWLAAAWILKICAHLVFCFSHRFSLISPRCMRLRYCDTTGSPNQDRQEVCEDHRGEVLPPSHDGLPHQQENYR